MTTKSHIERVRQLARTQARIAANDGEVCDIGGSCRCPTCGAIKALLDGALSVYCKDAKQRVRVLPAQQEASYPYLARILVDHREVYRVLAHADEVLDHGVQQDIVRALGGHGRC